jgi:recombination associated protein RdgC
MWFRNLLLYRLADGFKIDPRDLGDALASRPFRPCGGLDSHSSGWVPPAGSEATELVHAANGRLMVCLRREDRLLPAAVVREAVDERAAQISEREGRPVGRKERAQLRDEIVVDLLPRAFTRSRRHYAYIDPGLGLVVVDSSSTKQAEELLSVLRETLGSLPVRPIAVQRPPSAVLTRWLEKRPPRGLTLADECELREPVDQGAIVRGRRLDLAAGGVDPHLDNGMQVSRVAIEWQERIGCVVCDDLGIRRLRFLDLVMNEATEIDTDDALARFDADFALMGMELARFIPALLDAFGGLDDAGDSTG